MFKFIISDYFSSMKTRHARIGSIVNAITILYFAIWGIVFSAGDLFPQPIAIIFSLIGVAILGTGGALIMSGFGLFVNPRYRFAARGNDEAKSALETWDYGQFSLYEKLRSEGLDVVDAIRWSVIAQFSNVGEPIDFDIARRGVEHNVDVRKVVNVMKEFELNLGSAYPYVENGIDADMIAVLVGKS